jgi:hypothetical protein
LGGLIPDSTIPLPSQSAFSCGVILRAAIIVILFLWERDINGSYNTDVAVFTLTKPLLRSDTEAIINGSGLFGFTASDTELTAYYVGDPNDKAAIEEFNASVGRADKLLGDVVTEIDRGASRLWAYGNGEGATNGYGEIQREFRPPTQDQAVATAQRVASRLAEREVQGTEQADVITEDQQALQERIAEAYEALPLNDKVPHRYFRHKRHPNQVPLTTSVAEFGSY